MFLDRRVSHREQEPETESLRADLEVFVEKLPADHTGFRALATFLMDPELSATRQGGALVYSFKDIAVSFAVNGDSYYLAVASNQGDPYFYIILKGDMVSKLYLEGIPVIGGEEALAFVILNRRLEEAVNLELALSHSLGRTKEPGGPIESYVQAATAQAVGT